MPDDPTLWTTQASDQIERSILGRLLAPAPSGRTLEVGVGTGRLIDLLERGGPAVAIDNRLSRCRDLRRARPDDRSVVFLAADGHHLPFRTASFSCVMLVRVLHRSATPPELLREVRRVLTRGGTLVVSYYPTVSAKTLHHRFWRAVHPAQPTGAARDPPAPSVAAETRHGVRPPAASTASIERMVVASGFRLEERVGAGWEEVSVVRRLPTSF
ncbi:MAG TPA: class I SAM-dependent methyltransferase, partial [Thermoplasmata archaeon]|nr:class I SAM-dependent methyltransferase [Thermoplasmata archaeon]